jgi:hypothetical protein
MCYHHCHHVCQPSLPLSRRSRSQLVDITPPSISCTFEFDRSTPWTVYPPHIPTYPTFSSLSSQSGLLLPSLHALLHPHSSSHLIVLVSHTYLSTHLPTYLLTHTPHLGHPHPPANTYLQTYTRENVPLEIFATARDSFPFVASTAPGFVILSCRVRALSSPVGG